MRDGIYSFNVRSDETVIKGIALIENNTIRGLSSSHLYTVERSTKYGKPCLLVNEVRHGPDPQGLVTRGFPAKREGEEGGDRFALEGESEGDINRKVAIQGAWLHDLPWPIEAKTF